MRRGASKSGAMKQCATASLDELQLVSRETGSPTTDVFVNIPVCAYEYCGVVLTNLSTRGCKCVLPVSQNEQLRI